MAELTSVTTIEKKIYIKGQYENCEWCGISNERAISKFANLWNFDSFLN